MIYVIKLLRSKNTRNKPFYSVVACANNKNSFAFKEKLGFLNPISKEFSFNEKKIDDLINKGAKISKKLYYRMKSLNVNNWSEKTIK